MERAGSIGCFKSGRIYKNARPAQSIRAFSICAPLQSGGIFPGAAKGRIGMFGQSEYKNEYQPLGYLGRIPLYLTTILVIVYVAAMVALALLRAGNAAGLSEMLAFYTDSILQHFQFWRFFTYPLVNGPTLWFAVEMYLLYSFGREVERFVGRTAFGALYFSLVVLGPCLLTAAGTWVPAELFGSGTVNLALFIAFCAIYPNVEIFWTFKAKWIAAVIIGINSLQLLAGHVYITLLILWATCLLAFLFIKYLRGQLGINFSLRDYLRQRRSRRSLRAVPSPRPPPRRKQAPTEREDVIESIDPLLDKIAKHGIGSLTPREREKLEQARAELLKKNAP